MKTKLVSLRGKRKCIRRYLRAVRWLHQRVRFAEQKLVAVCPPSVYVTMGTSRDAMLNAMNCVTGASSTSAQDL